MFSTWLKSICPILEQRIVFMQAEYKGKSHASD